MQFVERNGDGRTGWSNLKRNDKLDRQYVGYDPV